MLFSPTLCSDDFWCRFVTGSGFQIVVHILHREVCLWTEVFLPTFKGIYKRTYYTCKYASQHLSWEVVRVHRLEGLENCGTGGRGQLVPMVVSPMVGETASEITCCVVAWCIYRSFLLLPSLQIPPAIWKPAHIPPFPSAEQLQRTKGLESISNKLEWLVNQHWLNYKLKIYSYPEWGTVEGIMDWVHVE